MGAASKEEAELRGSVQEGTDEHPPEYGFEGSIHAAMSSLEVASKFHEREVRRLHVLTLRAVEAMRPFVECREHEPSCEIAVEGSTLPMKRAWDRMIALYAELSKDAYPF